MAKGLSGPKMPRPMAPSQNLQRGVKSLNGAQTALPGAARTPMAGNMLKNGGMPKKAEKKKVEKKAKKNGKK